MNTFFMHIPFSNLVDQAEGRYPLDELEQEHLLQCTRCAADLQWLTSVLAVMRSDQNELVPPAVVVRAKQLAQRLPQPTQAAFRKRLVAHLRFDSAQTPLVYGMRTTSLGQRQVLLESEPYMVDLRMRPEGELWSVAGQVLGTDATGQVALEGEATASDTLNANSEFSLPPVPAGTYSLRFALAEVEIIVPALDLK